MHIVEDGQYRVCCSIDRKDLKLNGITVNDLIERTPLGRMFIKNAAGIAKESTGYEWPGCGFSIQMDIYPDGVRLVFSERIDDFLYNLKQSVLALQPEQAKEIEKLALLISMAEEEEARQMIRSFEQNVQNV